MSTKRVLACEQCQSRNYSYSARKQSQARLELKKFCKRCSAYTVHTETK